MGYVLAIVIVLLFIYAIIFRLAGGAVRGVFGFFREFFEESLEGSRYQRTLSKLGAFIVTVMVIIVVIKLLQ